MLVEWFLNGLGVSKLSPFGALGLRYPRKLVARHDAAQFKSFGCGSK